MEDNKIFYKTKFKNDDKGIPLWNYCKNKYHVEERLWGKPQRPFIQIEIYEK